MKYFYTDPLKAAWMCREFNIRCDSCGIHGYRAADIAYFFGMNVSYDSAIVEERDRYYIDTEFYGIFKPQVGDDVKVEVLFGKENEKIGTSLTTIRTSLEDYLAGLTLKSIKILQRDGKAFFVPEVEND